jgi:hypothetical protein
LDNGRDPMAGSSPSPGSSLVSVSLLQVAFPSKELATSLIEVFFSHMWNATLIFHKESLISDYFSGNIPNFVALSVFALGSV